ncbi:hypothetical protein FQR65_LT20416 [Abscondita terminalis]|nr:hypothetical protein FQR65_LT20416 [Abscondita terminalis]
MRRCAGWSITGTRGNRFLADCSHLAGTVLPTDYTAKKELFYQTASAFWAWPGQASAKAASTGHLPGSTRTTWSLFCPAPAARNGWGFKTGQKSGKNSRQYIPPAPGSPLRCSAAELRHVGRAETATWPGGRLLPMPKRKPLIKSSRTTCFTMAHTWRLEPGKTNIKLPSTRCVRTLEVWKRASTRWIAGSAAEKFHRRAGILPYRTRMWPLHLPPGPNAAAWNSPTRAEIDPISREIPEPVSISCSPSSRQ